MSITTPESYTAYLKELRTLDFMQMILRAVRDHKADEVFSETNTILEIRRFLHDLDEIDNADFSRGDIDDEPF